MIYLWCAISATLLVTTAVVHASTYLPFDPLDRWPSVRWLPPAILANTFAAFLYYARTTDKTDPENKVSDAERVPRWMMYIVVGLIIYAFVNFLIVRRLNEGGGPSYQDGRYLLTSHGKVIREITQDKYHRHQAYEVRGFSGHGMLFASASLTLLVGAARLRRRAQGISHFQPTACTESPPAGDEPSERTASEIHSEGTSRPSLN